MIIVNEKGGLGNQMFQYALYLTLKAAGKDVKICTEHFDWASTGGHAKVPSHGQRFQVEELFDTCAEKASESEVGKLSVVRMDFFSRIRRKIGLRKKTHYMEEEMGNPGIEELKAMDNAFLDGYWQRFDYYKGVEQHIREEFRFRKSLDSKNVQLQSDLKKPNAVAIHVRRNDYLSSSIYVIQNENYYKSAMALAAEKIDSPVFYCFSDDVGWCRNNLSNLGYQMLFVDWNTGRDSYKDMQLMASCKTNIITNSTFSMWAAWLGETEGKTVYRPAHYYTDQSADENLYWPETWVRI